MQIIHVMVTQEDINNGCKGNSRGCPVFLALSRTVPFNTILFDVFPRAGVRIRYKVLPTPRESHELLKTDSFAYLGVPVGELPQTVKDFISSFDLGLEDVQPFEFDLEVNLPEEA